MKTRSERIDVTIEGVSLSVEYRYYPPYRGARDSLGGVRGAGPPLEPDEPESVEIHSIITPDDITELLSEKLINKIEDAVLDQLAKDYEEGEL